MRKPFILLCMTVLFLTTSKVYSQNELTRDKLLEEALLVRYLPIILENTDNKLFMCERISDLKRIGGDSLQHEITIEVVTFEQAHSPPYNLIRLTLTDKPESLTFAETPKVINVIKVEREENLTTQQFNKHCEK